MHASLSFPLGDAIVQFPAINVLKAALTQTTAPRIALPIGDAVIEVPRGAVLDMLLEALSAHATMPRGVPPVGEIWPGQGGINGGLFGITGQQPYYLIVPPTPDFMDVTYGKGDEQGALSDWDGRANTAALVASNNSHAAAEACAAFIGPNGHKDYYLGARHEMRQLFINVPHLFDKNAWYWTSTQYSASHAWGQGFANGYQGCSGKASAGLARAVRRFIPSSI